MPKMVAKTVAIATTRRLFRARPTSQSIIEQRSALDDNALPAIEPALDVGPIALLEAHLHRTRLEGPWLDLDEDLILLLSQNQRRRRDARHIPAGSQKGRIGEHVRLQSQVWILKSDAHLGPARVRVENIADKQHFALEDFFWISRQHDVDRLSFRNQRG